MSIDFESVEDVDGVRLPWNAFPLSHLTSLAVPLSCLYTPLKEYEVLPTVHANPPLSSAGTVLSPFSHFDPNLLTWSCPLLLARLRAPDAVESHAAAENSTIEYILPRKSETPPVYLIMVDVATEALELAQLKESLRKLEDLPPHSLIGFATVGKNVTFYELASMNIVGHVFDGSKLYLLLQLTRRLGLAGFKALGPGQATMGNKYFQPRERCESILHSIIDSLDEESFYLAPGTRKLRCTGLALSLGITLLEHCFSKWALEIMVFASGPCTYGKFGAVATPHLKDHLRSHRDIEKHSSAYFPGAKIFYDGLAKRALRHGIVTSFFVASIDQVGMYEMVGLADQSGGGVVYSDSFATLIFKNSFEKYINEESLEYFGKNALLEVKTLPNLKVCGLVGPAGSLLQPKNVSNTSKKYGVCDTTSWKMPRVNANLTYCVYFEVLKDGTLQSAQLAYIQFLFYYLGADGVYRLRVTTILRPVHDFSTQKHVFLDTFDEEAAVVAVARDLSYRVLNQSIKVQKAQEELDDILVKTMKHFSRKNERVINGLEVEKGASMLPQFFYHLRRLFILRSFNYSPDESVYYNHCFMGETVNNLMIMIQPVLVSYEQDSTDASQVHVEPVLLDSVSVTPTRILLLDTFFEVLIFHGSTVASWRKMGYQDQEEYVDFKRFLEMPREEVVSIVEDRFPLPRFVDCDDGGSQARFLYLKLNPSNSYNSLNVYGGGGAILMTDDISLQGYLQIMSKSL